MAGSKAVFEDLESGTPGIVGLEGAEPAHTGNELPDGDAPAPIVKAKEPKAEDQPKHSPKDMAALNRRIAELETSERYWADQAKNGKPAPEPKKADAPDELEALLASAGVDDDTAAGLLDDLGEKGVAALKKRGVLTMDQLKPILAAVEKRMEAKANALADSKISGARGQMTAEARLLKDYPELGDEKTPLAIATAKEFADIVAEDPSLKGSYAALRMAAKAAKATLGGGGGGTVADRMARIAAQGPARGSRSAGISEFDDDGDVEITPEAQVFINAGAKYGLTQESYRKNARRAS